MSDTDQTHLNGFVNNIKWNQRANVEKIPKEIWKILLVMCSMLTKWLYSNDRVPHNIWTKDQRFETTIFYVFSFMFLVHNPIEFVLFVFLCAMTVFVDFFVLDDFPLRNLLALIVSQRRQNIYSSKWGKKPIQFSFYFVKKKIPEKKL